MEKINGEFDVETVSQEVAEASPVHMTQTQIGTIGEVTVAAQLMLASGGRFSPFLPFADDDGIDLIVYDKVTGVSLPVQVKARTSAKLGKSSPVSIGRPAPDGYQRCRSTCPRFFPHIRCLHTKYAAR